MAVVGEARVIIRPVMNRVLPDINRGLAGVRSSGQKAGKDFGKSFGDGFTKSDALSRSFADFSEKVDESRVKLRRFNNLTRFLGPAITGLIGGIGALGGGLIVLGAALGNAARGSIVLVASLMALITAAATARFLLGGISEAYKAKINAQKASGKSNAAEEAALKRLEKARIKLKRLIEEEAPEALAAARERAAEAARGAADAILSANRAQRGYNEAQKAAFDALEDLNGARDRAREKLQQLRFELEGAAIGEKRARLEFEKARDSLQAVQDLPPNSRARQEAELAFAQAELNLRKAIDSNSDLKKEEDAATRAGVEGSKDVVDAKDALAKAQQREADLAIDTARAFERAARAQAAAQRAASDAAAGGRVERELNRRIADARQAVIDAEKDVANARANAAGNNALADAYKDLNAAGITLVETMTRLRVLFIELRKETSTPFLTLVNEALLILEANLFNFAPVIEETGRIVGQLALNFAKAFLEGEGALRLRRVWSTNNILLENLGDSALNLAEAFLIILEAAEPLITAFGNWAKSKSASFLADLREDGSGLAETFENVRRNVSMLGELFGNVFQGMGILGGVINEEGGAAQTLLEGLIERSANWVSVLQGEAEDGTLNAKYQGLTDNFLKILDLATTLGGVLLDIGAQPGIGQLADSLTDAVVVFGEIGVSLSGKDGPVAKFGEFILLFAQFTQNLTDSGALEAFFDVINFALEKAVEFTSSDSFQDFFQKLGPILAQAAALGFIWRSVKFGVEAVLGMILLLFTPLLTVLGFMKMLKKAGFTFGGTMTVVGRIFNKLLGPLGLVLAAVMLMWENSEMFRDSIMGSFGALGEVFKTTFEGLKPVFSEIGDGLQGVFDFLALAGRVVGDILSFVMPVITVILSTVIGLIGGIIESIAGLFSVFANVFGLIANLVQAFFGLFVGIFTGNFDMFTEKTEAVGKNIVNIFKGVVRFVLGLFRGIVNGFIDGWNAVSKRLAFKLPDWLGGFTLQLPQIPRIPDLLTNLALGGIVPATPGGMLARIGEAGRPERVEPLDPDGLSKRDKAMIDRLSGGGGATVNVYPSQGMDERELAELVSRKLAHQMRRGSI